MAHRPRRNRPSDLMSLYGRYSSLGIQIVFIVLIFTGLGYWLDQYLESPKPYLTGLLSLFGCVAAMIYMIKILNKKDS